MLTRRLARASRFLASYQRIERVPIRFDRIARRPPPPAAQAQPRQPQPEAHVTQKPNPLSGQLPTIAARLPSMLPIQGSGMFTAQQTSTETHGACHTISATGTFNGTFRTRFAGWGARTLRLNPADHAGYREDR